MIASITMTRNDWHALEQWKKFYEEYSSAIDCHIVVDNASSEEYKNKLKELFPNSIHLHRETNGGTTGAYNTGIRWVLENHPEIEAIFLIANDIWMKPESIELLKREITKDVHLGAVAPVLLDGKKEKIVAYGELLRKDLGLNRLHGGELFQPEKLQEFQESECLPGGICMVKSEVYRKVGLQDESLFMYSDENDFFFRTTQAGYYLKAFRDATAAHCHIVTEGKANDSSLAWYYIIRNHILLCKRYASWETYLQEIITRLFWYGPKQSMIFLIKEHSFAKAKNYYKGFFHGIFNITANKVVK